MTYANPTTTKNGQPDYTTHGHGGAPGLRSLSFKVGCAGLPNVRGTSGFESHIYTDCTTYFRPLFFQNVKRAHTHTHTHTHTRTHACADRVREAPLDTGLGPTKGLISFQDGPEATQPSRPITFMCSGLSNVSFLGLLR